MGDSNSTTEATGDNGPGIKRRKKQEGQEHKLGDGEQSAQGMIVDKDVVMSSANNDTNNKTDDDEEETKAKSKQVLKRQASLSNEGNDNSDKSIKRSRTSSIEKERLAKKIMNRASMTTVRSSRSRASYRFSASESIHSDIIVDPSSNNGAADDPSAGLRLVRYDSNAEGLSDDDDDEFANEAPTGSNNITTNFPRSTSQSLLPSTMRILSPFLMCQHSNQCSSCRVKTVTSTSITDTTAMYCGTITEDQPQPEPIAKEMQQKQEQQRQKSVRPTSSVVLRRGESTLSESSRGTILDSNQRSVLETLFQSYYAGCSLYHCQPNPGVLTALRFRTPALRVSGPFLDPDMLALAELLLEYSNTYLSHVKRLDFNRASSNEGKLNGQKGFKSHGAYALSRVLLQSKFITEVFLQRHKIGPYGAAAIFRSCQYNPTIKVIALRRCAIGEQGALAFATCILSPTCGLLEVDLSNCRMGYYGTKKVCDALVEREHILGHEPLKEIDLEGNLIFQEVMNAVTHGLGIIFAVVGTILLLERAKLHSFQYSIACGIYSASILVLFTCSTLYHSFFALRHTRYIFGIFDHCAIYLLIAGSYTAYIGVSFEVKLLQHWCLLAFIWICSLLGVYVEAFHINWQYKGTFSLCMYLGLGWACVGCLPSLIEALPKQSLTMLVMGGLGYTLGVPFFVRNNNLDHSIWHMFVLAASIFHWIGVYHLLGATLKL